MTATIPDCSPGSTCTNWGRSANKNGPSIWRASQAPLVAHDFEFFAAPKRKAGRLHPAKSSQDPHSVAAFWASNRSGILGELRPDCHHFLATLIHDISACSATYKT